MVRPGYVAAHRPETWSLGSKPMPLLLLLLICLPILANRVARRLANDHMWLFTGLTFGAVISPLSIGLYSIGFAIPVVGAVVGIPGLLSTMVHETPGFDVATYFGLRDPGEIVSGVTGLEIELINGVVWGLFYALVGLVFDIWRRAKRTPRTAA